MTRPDLKAIKERCKSATPGPFNAIGGTIFCEGADEAGRGCFILYDRIGYSGAECNMEADSQFFAHARQDLPDCVAHIEALERENAKLRRFIEIDPCGCGQCDWCIECKDQLEEAAAIKRELRL